MAFKGLRFAGLEWKNLTASKIMWVVIAAIAIMPLLYGGLYLAAFQDPYSRLDQVPVAVVNEDAGAVIAAEQRNLGDEVVDELKGAHDGLQWHFVSADQAQAGLEDGTYFMSCVIPKDFSASVASVDGDAPQKAQLKVEYNESENMLASQIGQTVWKEVRKRVSDTVATQYWTTVLNRVADSGKEIQKAAEGASELQNGLVTAQDGSATITTNLGVLKNGAVSLENGLGTLATGAQSLDAGLGTLVDGTFTLKNGTNALASGARDLKAGTVQVAGGASEVAGGATQLQQEGTSALASGANQLASATSGLPNQQQVAQAEAGSAEISGGIERLQGAAGQLADGAQALKGGLGQVAAGVDALDAGVAAEQAGAAQLRAGIGTSGQTAADRTLYGLLNSAQAALEGGDTAAAAQLIGAAQGSLSQLSDGAAQLETGAGSLEAGAQQVKDGIGAPADATAQTLYGGVNLLAAGIGAADDTASTTLYGGLNNLASGYDQLSSQLLPLVQQAPQLRLAIADLDAGAQQVNGKMGALVSGANALATGANQVNAGATSAVEGANQLNNGASQLVAGSQSAQSGAGQLAAGADSAQDGSAQLANGATELKDGSATLTSGLTTAVDGSGTLATSLAEGAQTAADQTTNIPGKASVMSDPVELVNDYYTTVKNYGTGFAPYFMALGLWVGGLVAGFVFKPLNGRLILAGANPLTAAFSNYLPWAAFAFIQATLLMVALQFGLHLQIDNVPAFYGMGYLTALVFAAIMQFLMAAFGYPGRFLAIILLMLQLTASAGTFPIQTTPTFFQVVNPYMPMTYVVEGMRQIMTGLDYSLVAFDCAVLLAIGVGSFALTCVVAWRKRTVRMDDLHPVLNLG